MNKHGTVIQISVQRMVCTGCGAEANASCNCGKPYVTKSGLAAEAIKASPNKSSRAIAANLGIHPSVVDEARKQVPGNPAGERVGRDGKSYSVRQRITDDTGLPRSMIEAAEAVSRRRIFLRCAEDVLRKAEQGAGLKFSKGSEIDDEIVTALESIIQAWTDLRDEILERRK